MMPHFPPFICDLEIQHSLISLGISLLPVITLSLKIFNVKRNKIQFDFHKNVTPVRTISANWHVCFMRITTVEMPGHVSMLSDH